jgi:hypothetical protein
MWGVTLLEEVIVAVQRSEFRAHLTMRWRGGLLSEMESPAMFTASTDSH